MFVTNAIGVELMMITVSTQETKYLQFPFLPILGIHLYQCRLDARVPRPTTGMAIYGHSVLQITVVSGTKTGGTNSLLDLSDLKYKPL